ncbi:MAG: agmatine deiminase [Ruminococcus sp.]|nr:agmatine deiminase [Ruminococcus sp.]
MKLKTTPKNDGFYMPAEFSPHEATVIVFPERPGSWGYGAVPAQNVFADIIREVAKGERVYVIVSDTSEAKARAMLADTANVEILNIPTDDSWARDIAPTFVSDGITVRGIDWQFNAWGGSYDGLYAHWDIDNAFASRFCEAAGYDIYDLQHFVLEGGSVHSDGEGTIMVTESCLLSKGRNPSLSREQIEEVLCGCLGGEKVLWLPRGIYNDETNEHVDNVCAFVRPGEVVLASCDNEADPQYALSEACLEYLENETDAKGRRLTVYRLPIPDVPVTITEHDLAGYSFEEGEDEREVGERLAASYVNFYFTNTGILLPQFGGENAQSDDRARVIMQYIFPDRKIIPVPAREIIIGGGNIHCITQQIPAVPRQKE